MHRPLHMPRSAPTILLAATLAVALTACSSGPSTTNGTVADAGGDTLGEDGQSDAAEDTKVTAPVLEGITLTANPPAGALPLNVDLSIDLGDDDVRDFFIEWDLGDGAKFTDAPGDQLPSKDDDPSLIHVWTRTHTYLVKGEFTPKVKVSWRVQPKVNASTQTAIAVREPADLFIGDQPQLVSSAPVALGDEVTVTFSVVNAGGAIDGAFETGVYLSTNATLGDDDDRLVHTIVHESGLEAGTISPTVLAYRDDPDNPDSVLGPLRFKVPADVPEGSYFLFVHTDHNDVVSEVNRADNIDFATSLVTVNNTIAAKPDLTITAPSFNSGACFNPLASSSFQLKIENIGAGEAKGLKFAVFMSADDQLDFDVNLQPGAPGYDDQDVLLTELSSTTVKTIAPGASLPIFRGFTVPDLPDGDYKIIAKIDLEEKVEETNEDNNLAISELSFCIKKTVIEGVDLGMTDFFVSPKSSYLGGSVGVNYTVKNLGTQPTPQFPATIYFCPQPSLSKQQCIINQTQEVIAPLAAGEEKQLVKSVTISNQTPVQDWYVYMLLDPDNKILELNEGNNIGVHTAGGEAGPAKFKVTAQAEIDLEPSDLGFHPSTVTAGEEAKISFKVTNLGSTGSSPHEIQILLSPDGSAANQTVVAKVQDNDSVEGQEFEFRNYSVLIPESLDHKVGSYKVGVYLNADNAISNEKNKNNNLVWSDTTLTVLDPKGGCYEDSFDNGQDNNTAANAAVLPVGKTDGLGSCGDDDWYKITVDKGHSLFVTMLSSPILSVAPVPGVMAIEILDPDGQTILDSVKNTSPLKQATVLTAAKAGDYYVRVFPQDPNGQAAYSLDVELVPPAQGPDLVGTALTAAPSATFPGGLTQATLTLTNLGDAPSGPFVLRYVISSDTTLDAADETILEVNVDAGVDATESMVVSHNIVLPSIAGGVYYVGAIVDATTLVAEADETNNFAVSNAIVLSSQEACTSDAYSGNHTVDDAASLAASSQLIEQLNVCPGLADWFVLDLPQGQAFSVNVDWTYKAGNGLLGVQILDASKTGVVAGSANPFETVATVPYLQTGGTYYVHVYALPEGGKLPTPKDYKLDIKLQDPDPTDVCVADVYEPNNASPVAPEIGCGLTNLSLCLGDEDWFQITMAKDEVINLIFDNAAGAFQIAVFDDPLKAPLASQPGNGTLTFTAPAAGAYFIRVSYKSPGNKPASGFDYSLKVDGGKGVDLLTEIKSVFPSDIIQGEDAYLTSELKNECSDNAGAFEYGYYYSADTKLDDGDVLLSALPVDKLDGKTALTVDDKVQVPVDAKPGPAYILVAVDIADAVTESQELNNFDHQSVSIVELCLQDALEPNGAPSVAPLLPEGKSGDLSLCPNELDWYRIDAQAGETLTITAAFDHEKGDLDMRLYEVAKFGKPVATGATKAAPEQIVYTAEKSTTYYVRVNGFAGASNVYDLSFCRAVGSSCVECKQDGDCGVGGICDQAEGGVCIPPKCDVTDPNACNDANSCTTDVCDPLVGCGHTNNPGALCEDGNACTLGATCNVLGSCLPSNKVQTVADSSGYPGFDEVNDLVALPDGGWVVVGEYEAQAFDVQGYVARYDAAGAELWALTYDAGQHPRALHAAAWDEAAGEIIAVGETIEPGQSATSGWIARIDGADGMVLAEWLIGDSGTPVGLHDVVTVGGGYVVGGLRAHPDNGDTDGWLAGYGLPVGATPSMPGVADWQLWLGGSGEDHVRALAKHSVGDVLVAGIDGTPGGDDMGMAARVTAQGQLVWSAPIGAPGATTRMYGVTEWNDGAIAVVGGSNAQLGMGAFMLEANVVTLSAAGTVLTDDFYPGETPQEPAYAATKTSIAYDAVSASDGSLWVAGLTGAQGATGSWDAAIWRLGSDGAVLGSWTAGDAGEDAVRSIISVGGIYAGGGMLSTSPGADMLIMQVIPPVLSCDDGNACTVDACNAASGCTHEAVADGTACGGGTCQQGVCM